MNKLHKKLTGEYGSENIFLYEIVIIVDDQSPRNLWLKGIFTATFPGRDGRVRVADVKTKNDVFRRPVSKLCPLDIRQDKMELNE
ncbi:hypothetical protein JTB14_019071 [Gonioctena quinquepunctata]|nr:hypothetical protein JTB14_019071 [Gonioctena quinquepunctata]